jgi:hypothetical protein
LHEDSGLPLPRSLILGTTYYQTSREIWGQESNGLHF